MTNNGGNRTGGADMPSFDALMMAAQEAHRAGKFDISLFDYECAEDFAPNGAERARAIRGQAVALDRQSLHAEGLVKAQEAYDLYDKEIQAANAHEYHAMVRREKVEGRNVLGRMIVAKAARSQIERRLDYWSAHRHAQPGISHLDEAYTEIEQQNGGETDQYRINLVSRLTVAHSIYGNRTQAATYLEETKKLAHRSEVPEHSTSAQLSKEYGDRSRRIAIARAATASAIYRFSPLRPSPLHTFALKLAVDYRIGL